MLRRFRNQKIGARILTGFLVVTVIFIISSAVGIYQLININRSYARDYIASIHAMDYLEDMSSNFQQLRRTVYGVGMSEVRAEKMVFIEQMQEHIGIVNENIANFEIMQANYAPGEADEEIDLFNIFKDNLNAYVEGVNSFANGVALDSSRRAEALNEIRVGGELYTLALHVDQSLDDLVAFNSTYSQQQKEINGMRAMGAIVIMIVIGLIGVGQAIAFGVIISRDVSGRIRELYEAANKLALGDINVEISHEQKDEIGDLMRVFGKMIETIRSQAQMAQKIASGDWTVDVQMRSEQDLLGHELREMVIQNNRLFDNIDSVAQQVDAGAAQLADASQSLAQGSGEQASSIEQISASIEQIASQTRENAQNAQKASKMALTAKQHAEQGDMRMQEMVRAMQEINESSTNISKVIKVIDDIAFQTNILALNAAVEAARAGEAGKGFAVVADEVRNLAAKSAQAAQETTVLIEDSIQKVVAGTEIATETDEALRRITKISSQSAELVQNIAAASGEQALGIDQISLAINQMAQVVQTNSAAAEETASVSEELSAHASELKAMVSNVKRKKQSASSEVATWEALGSFGGSAVENSEFALSSAGIGKY